MKSIILSLEIAFILVEMVKWQNVIKKVFRRNGRVKPFDCFACLSFWVALVVIFVPAPIIDLAIIPATTAIVGQIIGRIITEWKLK
jgi:hypothetical protein